MNIIGIIPSRYASTRFPGKPLALIRGKSMIQRVYEQAKKTKKLARVIVATDDERIASHVMSFGGEAVTTAASHLNGTSRCLEVIERPQFQSAEAVINIQGDEPFINPVQIDQLAELFADQQTDIATMATIISDNDELFDSNTVKVVIDQNSFALYFSRQAIPFNRMLHPDQWIENHHYLKHIGIYGYRTTVLKKITALPPSPLENSEKLEQLRWLENGFKIKIKTTDFESISIDTPADLEKILHKI
ncbi:MAG: 3-deoxy-manno-octulosonate cytidylyltransferase [Bacteroidetes bacterium]|nr:MAG: 3-deoxy-manno-octulosonate cytidylyltransferase [Bacteroidota bacterium]